MESAKGLIRTYCPMSKSRCGVIATVENGKFVRLEPDPGHPNRGICVKGQSAPRMVYDPLRLKYPVRSTVENPKMIPVSLVLFAPR
jgi:anaerobic selenocysteine-containing dehydrogenase